MFLFLPFIKDENEKVFRRKRDFECLNLVWNIRNPFFLIWEMGRMLFLLWKGSWTVKLCMNFWVVFGRMILVSIEEAIIRFGWFLVPLIWGVLIFDVKTEESLAKALGVSYKCCLKKTIVMKSWFDLLGSLFQGPHKTNIHRGSKVLFKIIP